MTIWFYQYNKWYNKLNQSLCRLSIYRSLESILCNKLHVVKSKRQAAGPLLKYGYRIIFIILTVEIRKIYL